MNRAQRRTWDAAIWAVQQNILELPGHLPVSDEQDRMLCAVFALCEQLTAKRCLPMAQTNAELAAKYRVSRRTVTNWRREGCPFGHGQWRVLSWLSRRRYAPAGAEAKFEKQLERQRWRAVRAELHAILDHAKNLKVKYKENGLELEPDSWLRRLRCPRR